MARHKFQKGNKFGNRFKKGQSGNPGGRPKSKLQSEAYRVELAKESKDCETNAELIAKQMVAQAIKGNVTASQHIAAYVEGKPKLAFDMKLNVMDELAERIAKGRNRVVKQKVKDQAQTTR